MGAPFAIVASTRKAISSSSGGEAEIISIGTEGAVSFERGSQLQPIHSRHLVVQNYRVNLPVIGVEDLERVVSISGSQHVVAVPAKQNKIECEDCGVVVHAQHRCELHTRLLSAHLVSREGFCGEWLPFALAHLMPNAASTTSRSSSAPRRYRKAGNASPNFSESG